MVPLEVATFIVLITICQGSIAEAENDVNNQTQATNNNNIYDKMTAILTQLKQNQLQKQENFNENNVTVSNSESNINEGSQDNPKTHPRISLTRDEISGPANNDNAKNDAADPTELLAALNKENVKKGATDLTGLLGFLNLDKSQKGRGFAVMPDGQETNQTTPGANVNKNVISISHSNQTINENTNVQPQGGEINPMSLPSAKSDDMQHNSQSDLLKIFEALGDVVNFDQDVNGLGTSFQSNTDQEHTLQVDPAAGDQGLRGRESVHHHHYHCGCNNCGCNNCGYDYYY